MKKKTTGYQRLLTAACELFSTRWYESVSIVEICKHAGLSNGAFYKHFPNKEAIFIEIIRSYLKKFQNHFLNLKGNNSAEKFNSLFSILFSVSVNDWKEINIFREGEYRYPQFERELRTIYLEVLTTILGREVRESEYIYILGGLRFLVRRPVFKPATITPETLTEIVLHGIYTSPAERYNYHKIACLSKKQDIQNGPQDTKTKLINSGLSLFGEKGFHIVSVFEIAQYAGFSVGAFYMFFKSKEAFLHEVIQHISKDLQHHVANNIDRTLPRLYQEIQAQKLALEYFEKHTSYYQIIREAEFCPTKAVTDYYDSLENAYVSKLKETKHPNLQLVAAYLMGIGHHLGIEYFFSKNICHADETLMELLVLLENGIEYEG